MIWWIIIPAIVVFDLVLTALIIWAIVRGGWQPLMAKFPAEEAAPEAVARNFQSFRVGMMSFGHAIHVEVDEQFLHLTPSKMLRWCGAERVSVPWDAIEVTGRSRSGKWVDCTIGHMKVKGPAWCLELAGGDRETPA